MLRNITLCLIAILLPLTSHAAETYFDKNTISPLLLSPPYKDKSPEQTKELEYIIGLQKNPDPKEIEKANIERNFTPDMMVESVVAGLKRDKYPDLYALLDKVSKTGEAVTDNAKNYWHTDRPYIVDNQVKPLIKAHTNPSYPSGHTSGSYILAHVMNMIIPERGKDFYARADIVAQHRVLTGMHFPHDVEGGKQLALLTVGGLLQNKEFLADLAKAQDELKAHPVK